VRTRGAIQKKGNLSTQAEFPEEFNLLSLIAFLKPFIAEI
jgi:hypothetical protein